MPRLADQLDGVGGRPHVEGDGCTGIRTMSLARMAARPIR